MQGPPGSCTVFGSRLSLCGSSCHEIGSETHHFRVLGVSQQPRGLGLRRLHHHDRAQGRGVAGRRYAPWVTGAGWSGHRQATSAPCQQSASTRLDRPHPTVHWRHTCCVLGLSVVEKGHTEIEPQSREIFGAKTVRLRHKTLCVAVPSGCSIEYGVRSSSTSKAPC